MEGFLGFETFDFGIFWVGKFGKYFFVWLDLSRDIFIFFFFWAWGAGVFKTIWRFLVVPAYPGLVVLRVKSKTKLILWLWFLRLRISAWDFLGG